MDRRRRGVQELVGHDGSGDLERLESGRIELQLAEDGRVFEVRIDAGSGRED